jgi:diguanylate cyclase (GGDEF)-like protein
VTQDKAEWLGPAVDRAAEENRATRRQRAVSTLLAATIIVPSFGFGFSALWVALLATVELLDADKARSFARTPGQRRGLALFYLLVSTLMWSVLPLLLVRQGDATLTIIAIIVCCMQMMHAQSFAYRSRTALAIMIVPPALVLATVALGSGIPGPKLMILVPAMIVAVGYVIAGAESNAAAADALDASRREIERLAYTDPTTGIANRRRFAEELGARIDTARGGGFTLALVDLDGLKAINDAHGHDAGDAVLAELAVQLAANAGDGDLVARLGGDEFAWLITNGNAAGSGRRSLHYALDIAGHRMEVTASVGAAHFPRDGDTAETLFKAADVALYAAKRAARAA